MAPPCPGPAALRCSPPAALHCGLAAPHCGPAALRCGPAALRCGPAALRCGPAALRCGPAALRCGPAALLYGPAALLCGPAASLAATPPPTLRPRRPLLRPRRPSRCGPAAPLAAAPPPLSLRPRRLPCGPAAPRFGPAAPPAAAPPSTSRPRRPPSGPAALSAALPPYVTEPPVPPEQPKPPEPPEPPCCRAAVLLRCPNRPVCVLAFNAEGRAIDFEVRVDDLQLFLQCDRADGLSLFDLTSGASPAPAADADATVRSHWATRDAAVRLAVHRHLPTSKRAHFSQYRSAQTLGVPPPAYCPLLPLLLRPTSLVLSRSVRRLPLAGDPALARARGAGALEGQAGAVEVEVEAAGGVGVEVGVVVGVEVSVAAVEAEAATAVAVGAEVAEVAAVEEGAEAAVEAEAAEVAEAAGVAVELVAGLRRGVAPVVVRASSSSAVVRPCPLSSSVSGTLHASGVGVLVRAPTSCAPATMRFSEATQIPRWGELSRAGVAIYDLDFDAILSAMYAVSISDEGDCYRCFPPNPGIETAALGTGEAAALGTTSASASLTFTLDSGASRSFFRDRTTLTPLSRPVAVSLADPSGGPVLSHFSTVLPCPAAPSGTVSGLYLPSFSTNLVSGADLQDGGVHQFTPAHQRVTHYTEASTGRHLATFTRQPGSSLYTLTTASPSVVESGRVTASSQVFAAASRSGHESAPCSCRLLSYETLLWHHRLGHPSLLRLRGMASRLLVSGLPRSLPPLLQGPGPTCVPCVEGRQRAAPHSSQFPPTEAPLQTLHMDVWGPARVRGQGHERYFLLVVNDYSRYTAVFPLSSTGDVTEINLHPRVSRPETSQSLLWTGKVSNASAFRDVTFDEPVPYYRLFPYRTPSLPPPPLFLVPGPPPVDPLPPQGPSPSGVSHVDAVEPVEVTGDSGAAEGAATGGAEPGGAEPGGAAPGVLSLGVLSLGVLRLGVLSLGVLSLGVLSLGVLSLGVLSLELREWFARRWRRAAGVGGSSATEGAAVAVPGGARTGSTRAAGPAGSTGAGAAEGVGAETTAPGPPASTPGTAGGSGASGVTAGAGAPTGSAGAVPAVSGVAARPRPYFVPLLQQVLGLPPSTSPPPSLECPQPVPSQLQLQPTSPLPAPSPYTGPTGGLAKRREPASRPASPVRAARASGRGSRQRPPPVRGTHRMSLRPSIAPLRAPLPCPPESSLPAFADPESDSLRAASPTVTRLLATVVTDPSFESTAASALVAELVDFAARCRLDYAASLVAESESVCPPSVGGECALGTDVLEDRQEEFQCLAVASPHLVSVLLTPEGDPDALDIPTPRSYAEAIEGPYSSQWQAAMDAEMASWKSTGTYVDGVPPLGANIVSGMWIFRVKRPPGSPPVFKARYMARGFSHRQGVDYFQTFSPTPKMTTLRVLLHVAAHRDYELHSLDFSTAFLQGSLHEEIRLRRPPGFTSTSGMGLVRGGRSLVVLTGHADASWADDQATQRSSQGYTFSLGSGSVSWRATRSSSVLGSSCEAEIYAGAMAAQELRWLTYLLTDLGESPRSPPVLYVDNKAMLALCREERLEHRTKHIALRYFLARELQQRGQLRLAYVASEANTADVFTKALAPCDHQRFCTQLGLVPVLPHLLTS
ncbi:unnamed protein product [Closterium sp. NIES-64]|nr:unnamed protein product [Closterium sp. NIES-64]